jgi:hypothetical protein
MWKCGWTRVWCNANKLGGVGGDKACWFILFLAFVQPPSHLGEEHTMRALVLYHSEPTLLNKTPILNSIYAFNPCQTVHSPPEYTVPVWAMALFNLPTSQLRSTYVLLRSHSSLSFFMGVLV